MGVLFSRKTILVNDNIGHAQRRFFVACSLGFDRCVCVYCNWSAERRNVSIMGSGGTSPNPANVRGNPASPEGETPPSAVSPPAAPSGLHCGGRPLASGAPAQPPHLQKNPGLG